MHIKSINAGDVGIPDKNILMGISIKQMLNFLYLRCVFGLRNKNKDKMSQNQPANLKKKMPKRFFSCKFYFCLFSSIRFARF